MHSLTNRLMLAAICGALLLLGLFGVASQAGAAAQALVCNSYTQTGNLDSCTGGYYTSHPPANALVRKGHDWDDFTSATFGSLAPTDVFQVCLDGSTPEGATFPWPFDQWADPCHQWGVLPASTFVSVPPVDATMTISWDLPIKNVDDSALTGQAALDKIEVFVSTSPISSTPVGSPTMTIGPILNTSTVYSGSYVVGTVLYIRVRVRNLGGVPSALSNELTKTVTVPQSTPPVATPGMPTNVAVQITISTAH